MTGHLVRGIGWAGVLWLLAGAAPAVAWGPAGHILVAEIAQRRLEPEARLALRREFNIIRLADVANWADQIKSHRRETRPWHYTNLPEGETRYLMQRDCPAGNCVTEKITGFIDSLKDPATSRLQRLEALKFLVHLVADVHQPMHLGNPEDRGGNEIKVRWRGQETNLHAVWDHDLIRPGSQSLLQYAAELERAVSSVQSRDWLTGGVREWTLESRRLALEYGYARDTDGQGELSPAYIARGRTVVKRRLQQAGLRLADLLNRHLKQP